MTDSLETCMRVARAELRMAKGLIQGEITRYPALQSFKEAMFVPTPRALALSCGMEIR